MTGTRLYSLLATATLLAVSSVAIVARSQDPARREQPATVPVTDVDSSLVTAVDSESDIDLDPPSEPPSEGTPLPSDRTALPAVESVDGETGIEVVTADGSANVDWDLWDAQGETRLSQCNSGHAVPVPAGIFTVKKYFSREILATGVTVTPGKCTIVRR